MVSEVPLNFSVIPETVPSRPEARAMQIPFFPEESGIADRIPIEYLDPFEGVSISTRKK